MNAASLLFLHTVYGQVCLAANTPDRAAQPALIRWIATVVVFNSISLVLDVIDIFRFLVGDRKLHST